MAERVEHMELHLPRYDKKRREQAKREEKFLFTLDVDGGPAKRFGRMTFQACVPEALAREMIVLFQEKMARVKTAKKRKMREFPKVQA